MLPPVGFIAMPPMTVDDAALLSSDVSATEYPAYNPGTAYAKLARVQVDTTDYHWVFESAQAANTGHNPVTDDETWWVPVSVTNRWRMFDSQSSTRTAQADSIEVSIQTVGLVDTVAFVDTFCVEARIVMTDAVEGVVYDETFDMLDYSGIVDAYAYGYGPIVAIRDKVVIDLPPYADTIIDITLTAPGETVFCGVCAVGQRIDVGGTQWGGGVGLTDTSVSTRNPFGDYGFVQRPFYKTGDYSIWINSSALSWLQWTLAQYRAQPIIWAADPDVGATIGIGKYNDLRFVLSEASLSLCTLNLEMLPNAD